MVWTGVHHAFEVKTFFFKTGESLIDTQRAFYTYFMLHKNDAVLDRIFNT